MIMDSHTMMHSFPIHVLPAVSSHIKSRAFTKGDQIIFRGKELPRGIKNLNLFPSAGFQAKHLLMCVCMDPMSVSKHCWIFLLMSLIVTSFLHQQTTLVFPHTHTHTCTPSHTPRLRWCSSLFTSAGGTCQSDKWLSRYVHLCLRVSFPDKSVW